MATIPGKRASNDPNLRDRLYELLEHDHLPHSVGSRFAQAIVAIIVLDVLAMILASVPEFDAGFGWLFPDLWLRSAATRRADEIERQAPLAIDLIASAVAAGISIDDAIRGAATSASGPLRVELETVSANLALGHEAEVPVLGGTTRLKIPAGTQPGEILRLRGKGMPHLRHRGHGDACYRVVLEVPQKLNAKQRETLAAFEAASKEERGPLASAFFERMKKLLG